jgi:hypothetical protein
MNPRAEACERLGGRYDPRVLEPSPPAVREGPWFADDPVVRGDASGDRPVVSPVPTGDVLWEELAAGDGDLWAWCAERWLVCGRRLEAAPEGLVRTRVALHRLAEHVISPARQQANGKMGLRYTRGGFGTPFFGDDVQLRVVGDELVVDAAGVQRSAPIATLAAAADHVGRELLPDDVALDDEPLLIDAEASRFLGDWYGFAAVVLETLRATAAESVDPSRVQLWPEHFDLSVELGVQADGARAAYGLSPGDEHHPEPYLYVAPWVAPPAGELWQASAFAGAELPYAALLDASDQRTAALEFFCARLEALTGAR